MKIAMLTSDYLPSIGGIASHIYQVSLAMQRQGHTVEVWYWDKPNLNPALTDMGSVPVRVIPAFSGSSHKQARQLSAHIRNLLQVMPVDVLHLHTMDPLLLSMNHLRSAFSGPIVWTNHSSRFVRKVKSWPWRLKMRYYTRSIDGLLTASEDRMEASQFLRIAHQLNVANGVDAERFQPQDRQQARETLGLPPDRFVILYTGRFAPVKGVEFLAQALIKLHLAGLPFQAVFCGNIEGDRESSRVMKQIDDAGLDDCCRFEGFIPNSNLPVYLAACDVLALPSLMEATSISALEAMSSARAVVGTQIGGIAELVENGVNGFLCKPSNPDDLARAINEAFHCKQLDAMGQTGRERVLKQYTWACTAGKILDFYQSLLVGSTT